MYKNIKPKMVDLHIRCTEEEKQKIKILSIRRRGLSKYCLDRILNGKSVEPIDSQTLKVLRNCAGLSSNVNQIAKRLNSLQTDKLTIAMAEDVIRKLNTLLHEINSKTKQNEN